MGDIRLINDPGALPWIIVAAYALATLLATLAASVATGRERTFWIAVAAALAFLGMNKQLDLQTDLTEIIRTMAGANAGYSWHEYSWRRDLQGFFLLSILLASAAGLALLWFWLRYSATTVKWAAGGVAVLLAFVFIRAAAFHHIDYWLPIRFAARGDVWSLELVANAVVGSAALTYYRNRRGLSRSRPG